MTRSKLMALTIFTLLSLISIRSYGQTLQLSSEQAIELVDNIKTLEVKSARYDTLLVMAKQFELRYTSQNATYNELLLDYQSLYLEFEELKIDKKKSERFTRIKDFIEIGLLAITTIAALIL